MQHSGLSNKAAPYCAIRETPEILIGGSDATRRPFLLAAFFLRERTVSDSIKRQRQQKSS